MTTFTKTDARQIISRDQLQQLYPNLSGQELDDLLRSIDSDLTLPCRMDASASPDLTVTLQSGIVSNAVSQRQRSLPFVGNSIPSFSSGTLVFPATSGGNIVVTPGSDVVLTIPSNQYVKVLVSIDAGGQLVVSPGSADAVEANATPPAPSPTAMPLGYITVFNNAGTIDPIAQDQIFQFMGGGGSSGSQSGFSQEVSIPFDVTSVVVTFPTPLPSDNYVVTPAFINETDPDVQYQSINISNKTAAGFTASWNDATDSANYKLAYIVPAVQEQVGEVSVPASATSITIPLPIELAGVNYSVIPGWVNETDAGPQFQPITITAKTTTSFTASWNDDVDSANYRLSYRVAAFQ